MKSTILYESANTRIFLEHDENAQPKTVLKVLQDEYPDAAQLRYFRNEFEISEALPIAGVRRALEVTKHQGRDALRLDYFPGHSVREYFKQPRELLTFLRVATRLAKTLGEVHDRNVIHKDINPNNILVNPDDLSVCVMDFGISSRFSLKEQNLGTPRSLEGTIKFISPEQTGRMNRAVDYRSDLYSLGATFYFMLTGESPFASEDPMELVHAHLAHTPTPPHLTNVDVPEVLSEIVLKLLAKNAEDRYQSAFGLFKDLQRVLEDVEEIGSANKFKLAQDDFSGRFSLPQHLYGREEETETLLAAYERATRGSQELLLVAGGPGVGKSSLVAEVHKPITASRGYFIQGKFDQFQKNIPYSAILQAFDGLMDYLLSESDEVLETYKARLQEALGTQGKVLTELIPSLALVVGEQPEVPALQGEQANNRFNQLFKSFAAATATPEHPLVLFIDDWQWADPASLNLLQQIATDTQIQNLLIIAAYRDNEVDEAHPFTRTLAQIQEAQGKKEIEKLRLDALSEKDVENLVRDALAASSGYEALAAMVYRKTGGNAFFVSQFLQTLYEEEELRFDRQSATWKWGLAQIEARSITENVVELLANKIQKFPENTQELLRVAACVGNRYSLAELSQASGETKEGVRTHLVPALEGGIVIPAGEDRYKFAHDRIQQAAYSLIEELQRAALHARIGHLMLDSMSPEKQEEQIISIVSQLNFGEPLLNADFERFELAHLNFLAGQKAKKANAHTAMQTYFAATLRLYGSQAWEVNYDEAFNAALGLAEANYLLGQREQAEKELQETLSKAKDKFDKAKIHIMRIAQFANQTRFPEGVAEALTALGEFGIELPEVSDAEAFQQLTQAEFGPYAGFVQEKGIDAIGELHLMEDREALTCSAIITAALDSAFQGVPHVYGYFVLKNVSFSLAHGLAPGMPFTLTNLAVVLMSLKDYNSASQVAQLAERLNQRDFADGAVGSKFYHIYAYATMLFGHISETYETHMTCNRVGMQVGDFVFAVYGLMVGVRFLVPLSLKRTISTADQTIAAFMAAGNVPLAMITQMEKSSAMNLSGQGTDGAGGLSYEGFDEATFLQAIAEAAPVYVGVLKRYKIEVLTLRGQYEEAWQVAEELPQWMALLGGLDQEYKTAYYFYRGLTASVLAENAEGEALESYKAALQEAHDEIQLLAKVYPKNFEHARQILAAELAKHAGNRLSAQDLYDSAMELASENEFASYAAIAAERALRFHLEHKKQNFASLYFDKATKFYRYWGASAKAEELEKEFPQFRKKSRSVNTSSPLHTSVYTSISTSATSTSLSTTHASNSLDLGTVIKASQALAREVNLKRVLASMLHIAIENAGAQRGVFLLRDGQYWKVQAEFDTSENRSTVLQALPLEEADELLSRSLVNLVLRRRESFLSANASEDERCRNSNYVQAKQPKSVLCLPVLGRGQVIAVLYLENNLTTDAFAEEQLEVLKMLSAQIGISIENAQLYENLEAKVEARTEALNAANHKLAQKNQDITSSINYASRIQQAFLPADSVLRDNLTDFMVLYKPRDIVSGDFYWANLHNGLVFLIAADCTGHGVPGALMSVLGKSLLDEIILTRSITSPGEILDELDKGVRKMLKQEETGNLDGMDIAVCVLNRVQNLLHYAGAKNSLYYVENGELQQIKANRASIGGHKLPAHLHTSFTTHEIPLNNQRFYIFSDGYQDQIGGPKGRKFMSRQMRELLQKHHARPMSEQHEFLNRTIIDWMGTENQLDDILVMGFRA